MGLVLLLMGVALMVYSVNALYGMPYLCAMVLLWLGIVEYAVARAWWDDLRDVVRHRP